ncbi:hypothetical protein [Pseudomonas putida]|uniref:hypothetical protein n=1 Tax=Pseudomonas putida TaxID=303 RepID=UPI00390678E6
MATELDVKKLFTAAVSVKVVLAGLSVIVGSPYICGLILPLLVMGIYIWLGIYKRDGSISDEKFADSCYYLGFIFTIASIIASLFDLHNIGTGLGDVAARFGAAMISTCLGVIVRVVLVSFRQSSEDALKNVEDSVLSASRRLTDEFSRSFDQLVVFRGEVIEASRIAVTGVKDQIDSMAELHRQQTETFFSELTEHNKATILSLIQDISNASMGLSRVLDKYQIQAGVTTSSIDKALQQFIKTLTDRLAAVEFPQDIFSSRLADPIAKLNGSTVEASNSVKQVSENVKNAAKSVSTTVEKINTKAETLSEVLSNAQALSAEQQELLFAMKRQQQAVIDQLKTYQDEMLKAFAGQQGSMVGKLHEQMELIAGTRTALDMLVEHIDQSRNAEVGIQAAWLGITQVASDMGDTVKDSMAKLTPAIVSLEGIAKQSANDTKLASASVESLGGLMGQLIELNRTQLYQESNAADKLQGIAEIFHQMQVLNANFQQFLEREEKYSLLGAAVEKNDEMGDEPISQNLEIAVPFGAR